MISTIRNVMTSYLISCLIFIIMTVALSGCATIKTAGSSNIIETDLASVQNCQNVGFVWGHSSWAGLMANIGVAHAKKDALAMAASRNATHVVWTHTIVDVTADVTGQAYRCKTEAPLRSGTP
jgi:hypothetical protein